MSIRKLIGIGKLFTAKPQTRNIGYGLVNTDGYSIGKFGTEDVQSDPSHGLVIIDGQRKYVTSGKASVGPKPIPVEPPAPMTLRFAFSQDSTDPNTLGLTKGTWTKVDNYPGYSNVWDWTYDNANWHGVFNSKLTTALDPDVKIIEAGDTNRVTDIGGIFAYCNSLTSIALFDTSKINDLYYTFVGCSSLTSVPLFDTSKVTNMSGAFKYCSSLTAVPLFNTSKVTNMSDMFEECSSLTSVPLFETTKVTNMGGMFYRCSSLTSVPLFDITNVNSMYSMLDRCPMIESGILDLYKRASSTGKVTSFHDCFRDAGKNTASGRAERAYIPTTWGGDWAVPSMSELTTSVEGDAVTISGTINSFTLGNQYEVLINGGQEGIYINNPDFSFTRSGLEPGDYTWELSFINNVNGYTMLQTVSFTVEEEPSVLPPGPMTLRFMFNDENADPTRYWGQPYRPYAKGTWTKVDNYPGYDNVWDWTYDNADWSDAFNTAVSPWEQGNFSIIECGDISAVSNMGGLFYGCTHLGDVCDDFGADLHNVTNIAGLFHDCVSLEFVPTSMIFERVSTAGNAFRNCSSLHTIPIWFGALGSNINGWKMFDTCQSLESGMYDFYNMYKDCFSNHTDCFRGAGTGNESGRAERAQIPQDWGGDLVPIPAPAPMTLRFAFSQDSSDPAALRVSGTWTKVDEYPGYSNVWDWTFTTNNWYMTFRNKLKSTFDPDIRIIEAGDTSALTALGSSLTGMFTGCDSLTSVVAFNTANVTTMQLLFSGCSSLTSVPLFDTSNVTNMTSMLNGCTNIESGLLDLYQQASSSGKVTSYSNCFTGAGTGNESGRAERAQIPTSWGGDA